MFFVILVIIIAFVKMFHYNRGVTVFLLDITKNQNIFA